MFVYPGTYLPEPAKTTKANNIKKREKKRFVSYTFIPPQLSSPLHTDLSDHPPDFDLEQKVKREGSSGS